MVVKAKSEAPVKLIKDVKSYTAWQAPSINAAQGKLFRQQKDQKQEDEQTEELITAEALQAIKDQAFTEGFESGRKEGLISAKDEIAKKSELLASLINELTEPLQQCGEKTQQELLELAFAISRQIVRRELKQDPDQLIAVIRESLKQLPINSKNIRILLHPDDASIIRELLSIDQNSQDSRWQLIEEPSMERGGCLLKTENSKVDASVDRQVAVLFSRVAGGQRAREDKKSASENGE